MEANATPRINGPLLGKYVGKNVTIWGKVTQLRGEEATVDANGSVRAKLNRESHLVPGNGVQIIGKVQPDLSVKVLNSIDLGTGVDFDLANTVVDITQEHRNLFTHEQ
ncbi:hypothetical protein P8C59_006146 [Phyllachora maydis]|uniref:Replication factor A protein 3 n=1 Tax=Phyllachora maydis TaxID=1825666 RepID=A0AAD9I6A2_9PEZI|nr:hypothetical protein P8C59_006146 [Phyllachora maydis]